MAGRNLVATKSAIATGTAAKTVLQIKAVSTPVKVKSWSISFAGISNTDAPILCELVRQTSGGTMSALTPRNKDAAVTYTPLMTAQHTATAEPTDGGVILDSQYVHPQTGAKFPMDDEIVQDGTWLGLRVTAGVSVSCSPQIEVEE